MTTKKMRTPSDKPPTLGDTLDTQRRDRIAELERARDAAVMGEAEAMALVINHEGHIARLEADLSNQREVCEELRDDLTLARAEIARLRNLVQEEICRS